MYHGESTRIVARLAACAGLLALAVGCASGSRAEWRRPDGSLDQEQRVADLAACQARYGPDPNAPMANYEQIRTCMRSKGWVYEKAPEAD